LETGVAFEAKQILIPSVIGIISARYNNGAAYA
jgi:hypothetical protein